LKKISKHLIFKGEAYLSYMNSLIYSDGSMK